MFVTGFVLHGARINSATGLLSSPLAREFNHDLGNFMLRISVNSRIYEKHKRVEPSIGIHILKTAGGPVKLGSKSNKIEVAREFYKDLEEVMDDESMLLSPMKTKRRERA